MVSISDLPGLWTRSLMAWPDGRRDTTTNVAWLQGIGIYADLRQPPGMPDFSHVKGLADLTMADCTWLARQQAFAGTFEPSGDNFEWHRRIDFQAPRAEPDIGRLFWQGETLVEEGPAGDYIEHWHRAPNLPANPCAGAILAGTADQRWGCLLRAGTMFMYARDRAVPLTGDSLAAAVATAPGLASAQALLDFEISFGHITGGHWQITRSTLPFRAGMQLIPAITDAAKLSISSPDATATPTTHDWDITVQEGDVRLLN